MFIKKHFVQESVVTDMSILNELEPAFPDEGKQRLQQLQVQIKSRLNNLKELFDREENAM